ncbi:hypothetical protein [Amycolatopsis sp. WAC 04197]|uniref:hypothetical protein n=1 Tax=Amycolatopsis sp. WAC 04197 TaxID=2203199 RepID=UPI000F78115D|nr:hypothetical protein [Amycolatopsis sp. WAC 04197]
MSKSFGTALATMAMIAASVISAPTADASAETLLWSCGSSWNPYDPEQGSGAAWSSCSSDAPASLRHRVGIWCNGSGPWWGGWTTKDRLSTTYCSGGERATNSAVDFYY